MLISIFESQTYTYWVQTNIYMTAYVYIDFNRFAMSLQGEEWRFLRHCLCYIFCDERFAKCSKELYIFLLLTPKTLI